MTYGKSDPTHPDDPDLQQIKLYMMRFGKYIPVGSHIVDNWPILKYVPFVTSELRQWHREESGFYQSLLRDIREKMVRVCLLFPKYGHKLRFVGCSYCPTLLYKLPARAPTAVRLERPRAWFSHWVHVRCRFRNSQFFVSEALCIDLTKGEKDFQRNSVYDHGSCQISGRSCEGSGTT